MDSEQPINNFFRGSFSNFGAEDGDVRTLGYGILQRTNFSYTDLALYKTRNTQKYNHHLEILLGPDFNDVTLDYILSRIEEGYPKIQEISART